MFLSQMVYITVVLSYASAVIVNEEGHNSVASDQRDFITDRTRRSVVTLSYRGYIAATTLLKGAVKDTSVPKYSRQIKYVKEGDLLQALMDFSSVSPKKVRSFQTNKMYGQVGFAGDRTIIIRQDKSGTPIIKFFKTTEANDPKSPRTIITYRPTSNAPGDGSHLDFEVDPQSIDDLPDY